MMKLALSLLFVTTAYAQDAERVFRLSHTPATLGQQEIATTLRTVGQIQKVSVDPVAATVTVHGSAAQIALTEWLVPRLDAGVPGPQSYNVAANPNDVVVVYPLAHLHDMMGLQETITTMRTVLDFRYIYTISAAHTIAWRGTAENLSRGRNFGFVDAKQFRRHSDC